MWGANEFGPDFQRILVRGCIDDPDLRGLVNRFVGMKQLSFTDPASQWAWGEIIKREYPTLLVLQTEAARLQDNDPARVGAQAIIMGPDIRDTKYVREQIIEWARRQLFKLGFEEARQSWNAGKYQDAMDSMLHRIDEISNVRILEADRGWFFEEFDKRQMRRMVSDGSGDFFPTGIPKLDAAMRGGLHYGELGVPMAYAKVGKTFFVIQQGLLCARTRRKALHIVLEGGRRKTEDRYEAAFAEAVYNEVRRGAINSELARKARREYAILKENLVIRGFSDQGTQWQVSYEVILGELAELRRLKGWVADMVIVDYGDLMFARGDSEFERQKNAFRQLKSLSERVDFAGAKGYAVWAPTQAQRPDKNADAREHILKPRDIADSYEKVRVCDAIVTLNRMTIEREAKQARVHLGAYRDAEDGATIRVSTDYEHGLFCKIGEENEPLPPPPPASGGKSGGA